MEMEVMKLKDTISAERMRNKIRIENLQHQLRESKIKITHLENQLATFEKEEQHLKVNKRRYVYKFH